MPDRRDDWSVRETDWFAVAIQLAAPDAEIAIRHHERLDAGAERRVIVLDEYREKERET